MRDRKGWIILGVVTALAFGVLLWGGAEIWRKAPPLPTAVVDSTGATVFTGAQIQEGQNVWQSIGGQQVGSIWGHGAYVAPDWSADRLHREAISLQSQGLAPEEVKRILRENGYEQNTGNLTIGKAR